MSIYHQILGVPAPPKPATDKLLDLYKLIRDDYQGILTEKDLSSIYFIIGNRIDKILEEEKQVALDKPDYLSYAEQARDREKSGFGM